MRRVETFRYPSLELGYLGGRRRQWDREARLERVLLSDVADLVDVSLDKLQTIPFYRPAPLLQEVLDAPRSCADPMKLEVETGGRIMNDIVV